MILFGITIDLPTLITGAGGIIGIWIIITNSYHNYRMRVYAERQAIALEKMVKEK